MGNRTRLQAIYDMVKAPCIVADIGCDHGFLPITLVRNGKCSKAYACDINPRPLARAQKAIIEADMQEQVFPVLCNGIQAVSDDVTTLVIAGMGFDTITQILSDGMEKISQFNQIIVQCNGHVDDLRLWLSDHGFRIDDERIVKDRHFYQMISMHYEPGETLTPEECLFGKFLPNDPMFVEYWTILYEKKQMILQNLPKQHEYYQTLKQQLDNIKHTISICD